MAREDLGEVAAMFLSVFRRGTQGAAVGDDLRGYLADLCFGSPAQDPRHGSLVYRCRDGRLLAVLLGVPMRFRFGAHRFTARLLCSFMAEGTQGLRAAVALIQHVGTEPSDLVFSDTAIARSVGHFRAWGGDVLPVESLEWRLALRPLRAAVLRLERHVGSAPAAFAAAAVERAAALAGAWAPRLADWSRRAQPVTALRFSPVPARRFAEAAEVLLDRFDLRPDWSGPDFDWICAMAARNRRLGALRFALAEEASGRLIAAYAWCARPGGEARVLNLVNAAGAEPEAVATLLAALTADGQSEARGMAHPFLLEALQRQPGLSLRHRGYFCVATRSDEIAAAATGGRFYAGGLASESWSRLLTDF